MSVEVLHIIKGKFKGTFSTNQNAVLEEKDLLDNQNLQNKVRIFEGNVSDIVCFDDKAYDVNNADFQFENVNNIQLLPSEGWPYKNMRIFSFGKFVLKNAKIENSWFENEKTYGIISGDLYGTVLKGTPPDIDRSEDKDTENNESENRDRNNDDNNNNSDRNRKNLGRGCLSNLNPTNYNLRFNSGCWRWLKWLFWIILLLWLLRQCVGNGDQLRCYWEYIKLEKENKKLDDSLETNQRDLNELSDSILNCSNASSNGLNQITVNHHDLGKNSGNVIIDYNMNMLADMMEVYYDGTLVTSTDSLVSYKGVLNFQYTYEEDKPTYFTIKLIPGPNPDTKWDYSIICP